MFSVRRIAFLALGCAWLLSGCGGGGEKANDAGDGSKAGGKVLNLYIWSDYLAENTLSDFEKQTGIKVHVAYYDTNETLETKLLAGNSGFDVTVPSSSYFQRLIKAGAYAQFSEGFETPDLRAARNLLAEADPAELHEISRD